MEENSFLYLIMVDINKYIGKPWKSGAQGPDEFDCWGLLLYVMKHEFGIDIQAEFEVGHIHGKDLINIVRSFESAVVSGKWIKLFAPEEGCGVALSRNKKIHHSGVWLSGGCLHAMDGSFTVYNSLSRLKRNGYQRVEFYKWHK